MRTKASALAILIRPVAFALLKTMHTRILLVILLSGFLFSATSVSQATEYNFVAIDVDFPSFHDDLFGCGAAGINDEGLIVGGCNDRSQNSNFRGFLYDGHRFREIDFHHTKTATAGDIINVQGEWLHPLARSLYQSLFFRGISGQSVGAFRLVKPIVGAPTPQDINNQDHITGWYYDGTRLQGFLERTGTFSGSLLSTMSIRLLAIIVVRTVFFMVSHIRTEFIRLLIFHSVATLAYRGSTI